MRLTAQLQLDFRDICTFEALTVTTNKVSNKQILNVLKEATEKEENTQNVHFQIAQKVCEPTSLVRREI